MFCSCTIQTLAHPESSPFQSSHSPLGRQSLLLFARLQKRKDVCRTSTWKLQVCYISSDYANECAGFSAKSIHQMATLMPALWFCNLPAKDAGVPFSGSSCWRCLMSQTMALTRNWHLAADFTNIQQWNHKIHTSSDITGFIKQWHHRIHTAVCLYFARLVNQWTVAHGGRLTNRPPSK